MAQKKERHLWTEKEWLYCLYIAKFVEQKGWNDFIREKRISTRVYGREGKHDSAKMGCQNFQWLITGGKKGLRNCSKLQKKVFKKYGVLPKEEFRKLVFD